MTFEDSTELQFKRPALCLWPLASPLTNKFTFGVSLLFGEQGWLWMFPQQFFSNLFTSHDFYFFFFQSKHFSYFCCTSCNEILDLSVWMLNILQWESYTMKIICKGRNFYSFCDKFYHWQSVCIQLLVLPGALCPCRVDF